MGESWEEWRGGNEQIRGEDIFFTYNELPLTVSKDDSFRNREHCAGQMSHAVRSTTKHTQSDMYVT